MSSVPYDDIDAINAAASDEFGPWGPEVTVDQATIDAFAELTGDRQWIHVDVERATAGPFGGPIAHGFLTLSLLPTLVHGSVPVTGHTNAVNYGADRLRFLAPVPAGSAVHARSRLIGGEAKRSGTLLRTEVAVHVVGNDTPSVLYEMLTLYQG